jgi:hypothetical protein
MVELYLYSPIGLHGILLNYLSKVLGDIIQNIIFKKLSKFPKTFKSFEISVRCF